MDNQESLFGDMQIVTVLPIKKGVNIDELTYLATTQISLGNIVKVPLRNQVIRALVIKTEKATDVRSELRRSDFSIKKITDDIGPSHLSPGMINAIRYVSEYFANPIGSVLASLVPEFMQSAESEQHVQQVKNVLKPDHRVIQAPDDERITIYKSLIRESFARKQSIFFCVPSIESAEELYLQLSRGITEYTYVFHSKIKSSVQKHKWLGLLKEQHPIVIIGTGSYLTLVRNNFDTIVIDGESSNFKQIARPFIDYRLFARAISKFLGIRLIYADSVLSLPTLNSFYEKKYLEISPMRHRLVSPTHEELVDMKQLDKISTGTKLETTIFSPKAIEIINQTKENNGHLVLLVNRKGLSPTTICADCGSTVNCDSCKIALVLHRDENKNNVYVCHMCQKAYSAKRRCSYCNSWRLYTFGFGIEKVKDEVKNINQAIKLFELSSDSVTSSSKARDLIGKFLSSPGSVLISTEMVTHYLRETTENCIVVNVDNLFSIPDFNVNERIFHLLTTLKRLTKNNFLIQTRHVNETVFGHILRGTVLDFYREEIAARKQLGYPPFSLIIKISREGPETMVKNDMDTLKQVLKRFSPVVFEAFVPVIRGQYRMNAIIRSEVDSWPNIELVNALRSLPPSFAVNVMPENLL